MAFPKWATVEFFDLTGRYDMGYEEFELVRDVDFNELIALTGMTDETDADYGNDGIEIYITNVDCNPGSNPGMKDTLHDIDLWGPEHPDIGLVFQRGVYVCYGLGDSIFAQPIKWAFEKIKGQKGLDFCTILKKAMEEGCKAASNPPQSIADEIE